MTLAQKACFQPAVPKAAADKRSVNARDHRALAGLLRERFFVGIDCNKGRIVLREVLQKVSHLNCPFIASHFATPIATRSSQSVEAVNISNRFNWDFW
jgi:hypothetical protein